MVPERSQKCHLLDLPAELRNRIYEMAFYGLGTVTLDLGRLCRRGDGPGKHKALVKEQNPLGLAFTCRGIYEDTIDMFFDIVQIVLLNPLCKRGDCVRDFGELSLRVLLNGVRHVKIDLAYQTFDPFLYFHDLYELLGDVGHALRWIRSNVESARLSFAVRDEHFVMCYDLPIDSRKQLRRHMEYRWGYVEWSQVSWDDGSFDFDMEATGEYLTSMVCDVLFPPPATATAASYLADR